MFYKKDVLTNFAKFTGNTCARVSILIKLQASGSGSTKMFLIWTKNICKFFRRFVCWKTRRKQVAIHKKSNYILQVFVLFFSLRLSFTLAVTCSNYRVWKHFKSIIVSFCTRKIEVTTHYLKTLINVSSNNLLLWWKYYSWIRWVELGQTIITYQCSLVSRAIFLWILLFSCDFTREIQEPSIWNVFRHNSQKALCLSPFTDVIQL